MANRRNNRLSGEMKRVISEVIRNEVKDPRLSELLSVTDVDVMEDLKYAKVYISVYGDIEPTLEALRSAKGFIRREVGKRIKMRLTPELLFEKDDSIEKGIYMSSLINKVIEDEESRKPKDESEDE
ncbi:MULTISPECIES: 30S ribosome-binding factor RbfA [Sedimentibacter]|uniref:Ribosome-binding factor A n=1 Tax=Sedimentibacter hydroxybenzoicus DSM 7310 TaxID=1123245 RepID=A0A974BK63_SEDHY|nr:MULTISPECIES: 30S ribosome-binding factor RbfA [Sedimentibacter]NYB74371.1 30S ribosome-binding factor RbfA [Sedimentibacter hydroxybenzoicus DSM 7310]